MDAPVGWFRSIPGAGAWWDECMRSGKESNSISACLQPEAPGTGWLPLALFALRGDGKRLVRRSLSMSGETEVRLRWAGKRKLCAPGLGVNRHCRPQAHHHPVCQAPYAKAVCRFFFFRRNRSLTSPVQFLLLFFFNFFLSLGLLSICALAVGLLVFLKPKLESSVGLLWSRHTSYIRGGKYPSPV